MKRYVFSILLLGILFVPTLLSQEKKIPVESSENWLNNQHQPEKLMDAIGLYEGMTIADIGAGHGRMTVWFADRVGENGEVLSNDIDRDALEYLERRCQENKIRNVKTIPGKIDDPLLPVGEVDIAFMVSVYHHLDKPLEMLRNTIPCLKNDGVLVIVERDPVKTNQSGRESTSREELTRTANKAGYDLIKVNADLLERDNIYFFKAKR